MSETWQQAASQVLAGRYPDGMSIELLAMRVRERSNDEFATGELYDWLCARAEEGTVTQGYLMWYASHAVMHPGGTMKGYYAHATLGEIGELTLLTGRLVMAALTFSSKRVREVVAEVEAVHSRIAARAGQEQE